MSEKINQAIKNLQSVINEEKIDVTQGMPNELFHFATTLMPCPNVDLFISHKNQVLLMWRDDEFYGCGWHIPGGCLRIKETLDNRIQETARNEIGTEVLYNPKNFITRESFVKNSRPWLENELVRSHNISMLFDCKLPSCYKIKNACDNEHVAGYLKWFSYIPQDLLTVHKDLYGDILDLFFKGKLNWKM